MAWPTIGVYLGPNTSSTSLQLGSAIRGLLGTNELGNSLDRTWIAISDDVLHESGVSLERGSTRQQGPEFHYEAGRLSFQLDNQSGDYDPSNLAGPYVTAGVTWLQPGLPIYVAAFHEGSEFPLFTGFVDSWSISYPGRATKTSTATVTATDSVGWLQASSEYATGAVGSGENTGTRIGRILNHVDWPIDARDLQDLGTDALSATTLEGEAWSQLQLTAESVGGYLWIDQLANVVFRRRAQIPQSPKLTFGEGEIPIDDASITYDWDQLFNIVELQRPDGALQSVRNTASIAAYGRRIYQRTDSVLNSDAQVAEQARTIVSRHATPLLRVENVVVSPDDSYDVDVWTNLLTLDMIDRVAAVILTPDNRTIYVDSLVRSINLQMRPFSWVWQIGTNTPRTNFGNFELGSLTDGILGTNTLVFD